MSNNDVFQPAAGDARTTAPMAGEPGLRRWLHRLRVSIMIIAVFLILVGTRELNDLVVHNWILALVVGFGTAVAALAVYTWLSRTVEGRQSVPELSRAGRWSGLAFGALIGLMAFTVTMGFISVFGGVQHISGGSFTGFLVGLAAMASVAVNEELLFRGVVQRFAVARFGPWIGLVISCVVFGLSHLVNGGNPEGAIAIIIQGGVVLGAAYIVTGNLWLAIGFHFAWDVTEGSIFSVTNSGTNDEPIGILHTTLHGSSLLTGGSFGPEGGLVAPIVCLVVALAMLRRAARTGKLRRHPRSAG
jgi:hypothetical protein